MGFGTFLTNKPTYLRGLLMQTLTESGQVGTRTVVSDGGGGGSVTWNYGSAIPCRIDPLSPNESEVGGRLSNRAIHLVSVPPGTVVEIDNRFLISGRGTYEVTAIDDHTLDRVLVFEVVQIS